MTDDASLSVETKPASQRCAIGIDVGGTKIAGGLVVTATGAVLARRVQPTAAERSGEAVLADVIELARALRDEAAAHAATPTSVGVGIAELVNREGRVVSDATIRWKGLAVGRRIEAATSLPAAIDADVRAAARAEAQLGAGRQRRSFVYITVGTGISACLVLGGVPYEGDRGLAGTFASTRELIQDDRGKMVIGPSLEQIASGPGLAASFAERRAGFFAGSAPDVLALAEAGDALAVEVVQSSASVLGAAIARLVNTLDPEAVVIGGGLGLAGGLFRRALEESMRLRIYSNLSRDIPLLQAELGADAGWIGAALQVIE